MPPAENLISFSGKLRSGSSVSQERASDSRALDTHLKTPLKQLAVQCDPQQRRFRLNGSGIKTDRKPGEAAYMGVIHGARAPTERRARPPM